MTYTESPVEHNGISITLRQQSAANVAQVALTTYCVMRQVLSYQNQHFMFDFRVWLILIYF